MSKPTVGDKLLAGGTIHSADDNDLMCEAADLIDALVEAQIRTAASLAAAISLLERGGKKAAPSDKMFAVMLDDYRKALDAARAALARAKGEPK